VSEQQFVIDEAGDTRGIKLGERYKHCVKQGDLMQVEQAHFHCPIVLQVATMPSRLTGWVALKGWPKGIEFDMDRPVKVRLFQ
jgi:hypothetical protein